MIALILLPACVSKSRLRGYGDGMYAAGKAESAQKIADLEADNNALRKGMQDLQKSGGRLIRQIEETKVERDDYKHRIEKFLGIKECRCVHKAVLRDGN